MLLPELPTLPRRRQSALDHVVARWVLKGQATARVSNNGGEENFMVWRVVKWRLIRVLLGIGTANAGVGRAAAPGRRSRVEDEVRAVLVMMGKGPADPQNTIDPWYGSVTQVVSARYNRDATPSPVPGHYSNVSDIPISLSSVTGPSTGDSITLSI